MKNISIILSVIIWMMIGCGSRSVMGIRDGKEQVIMKDASKMSAAELKRYMERERLDLVIPGEYCFRPGGIESPNFFQIEMTKEYRQAKEQEKERIKAIVIKERATVTEFRNSVVQKGFSTADDWREIIFVIKKWYNEGRIIPWGPDNVITKEAFSILATIMDNDFLPFKPMFYLALENENYDDAELIRKGWVNDLSFLLNFFTKFTTCSIKFPALPIYKDSAKYIEKINVQLEKLSIVGLSDQILITLRKELVIYLKEKKWDEAQKIQNLITARVNELRPPQPQLIYKDAAAPGGGQTTKEVPGSGAGQTTVVIQQPSEQHIKVEQIPRYGATDVGRAISLLQGRGAALTDKEAGTLKLIDILLKR